LVVVLILAAFAVTVSTQPRPPKVLVLYDMEGVSGATSVRHTSVRYTEEYTSARESLTADVNAAVAGLKAAGVTDITIVDGHGSGNAQEPDVLEAQLLAPAKMISRDQAFDIYMDSYDQSIDAVVAVAMHAGAGNRQGFLSHTYTGLDIEYKVNGMPFNESMIFAMGAARLKIPLIMVSGDDQLEKEIRRNLPWVEYATVKHAVERSKAEPLPREDVSKRIAAAAQAAIGKLGSARLPDVPGPYRFALTFQDEAQARAAAMLPGAEFVTGSSTAVQIRAQDFEEGYRQSLRLIQLAGPAARETAIQTALAGSPDAAALQRKVAEFMGERFLGVAQIPPPPPSLGQTGRIRYFGAR
jgi:D-amino peptidase